jgi:exonuclease SbcC
VILLKVRIESFAGLSDRELDLREGLNVVLGPNEAGKSTLFQAIRHTLLTPAALSRPQFDKQLKPFLPLGGGDSIACTIKFLHRGEPYQLAKRWGQGRSAELIRPDGSRLRGEEPIRAALASILPAGEGTLRTVFLAAQSALAATLEELEQNPEAAGSLADLLRRAVLQPDGMSISAFRRALEERLETLLGRWDLERGHPEASRGLENPWRQGAGEAVRSWYEREGLERRRQEAEQAELRLGELAGALQACRDELRALERRVREREPAAQSVWKRRSLERELESLRAAAERMKGGYDRWPGLERSLEQAARELPAVRERVAALEREKGLAEQAERRQRERRLLAEVRELDRAAAAASERLARLPALPRPELAKLEAAAAEAERAALALQASGAGQGIAVSFQARADITLQVSKDGEAAGSRALGPGETLTVQARGRARLEAPDWSLEASSAPEAGERRRREAEAARRAFDGLLAARALPSLEAARQACLDFELASGQAQETERRCRERLGGRSLEEVEREAAGPAEEEAPRELAAVLEELHEASGRLRELEGRETADREALQALVGEHVRREALLERIVAQTNACREAEASLAALPALPPEAADPDAFLGAQARDKEALERLRGRERELDREYGIAENSLPEESSEELAGRREEADRRHRRALRRARALRTVREASDAVLSSSDGGAQERFERALGRYAAELTAERYRAMPLAGGLPAEMERQDGLRLPFDLLSGGTRALFALALRLAMADAFLEQAEGFLVLDDPLVDLDPGRQERASAVLARFAGQPGRQLLLFTCHPAHAERFPGAHRVQLA